MDRHPLAPLLESVAQGCFPPADGTLAFLPAPSPYRGAVVAFTAHSVVAAGLPPEELAAQLPGDDLGAPMAAPFLAWLGQQLGVTPGMVDVVLVHRGSANSDLTLIPRRDPVHHPRVARAYRMREDVRLYSDPENREFLTIGRGLVGRWEVSLELDPTVRGSGLGRSMISAARMLIPCNEPLFAQVSPGNARSLRAFLAAGFAPIGAEVLFR